jgi:hypothetical protein
MESGDLFGPDYVITNAQHSGSYYAYSQFNGVNSNLGLDRGFVLTTGILAGDQGVLGPNNYADASSDLLENEIHPDLAALAQGTSGLNDASYITFTITPLTDTLVFNYVFGSDEYDEYVGSTFSDIAGIFISGPTINGVVNLANINGVDVTVNSVHGAVTNVFGTFPATNGQYYFNNQGPQSLDSTSIEYDGFTQNTVARIDSLEIGGEYVMTIAIADVGDGIYDSGIFIEACESCLPTLSSGEIESLNSLQLAPNPVTSSVTITASGSHEYVILNSLGMEVAQGSFEDKALVNLIDLAEGTYFVQLENGSVERFVKQ